MDPDKRAEMRKLVALAEGSDDPEEREWAKEMLRQHAADWRGFPGQRRRGEPPRGVEVR